MPETNKQLTTPNKPSFLLTLLGVICWWVSCVGFFIVHLWTVYFFYTKVGFLLSVVALCVPFFSELVALIIINLQSETIANYYSITLLSLSITYVFAQSYMNPERNATNKEQPPNKEPDLPIGAKVIVTTGEGETVTGFIRKIDKTYATIEIPDKGWIRTPLNKVTKT